MLQAKIYVFCGTDYSQILNSIEVISENALVPHSEARWQLINISKDILAGRYACAVSPINDTEIAILGGFNKSDVILFKTTTKKCEKKVYWQLQLHGSRKPMRYSSRKQGGRSGL